MSAAYDLKHRNRYIAAAPRYMPISKFSSCPKHPYSVATNSKFCTQCIDDNNEKNTAFNNWFDDMISGTTADCAVEQGSLSEAFIKYLEPKVYFPHTGAREQRKGKMQFSNAYRLSTYSGRPLKTATSIAFAM